MTLFEHYKSGNVFGIKYIFETEKDGLPVNAHDQETAHNIIVMRGKVKVVFSEHTDYLQEGDVYDFDWTLKHGVRALEPDSIVLNMFLNGQPKSYLNLPTHELSGEFQVEEFIYERGY